MICFRRNQSADDVTQGGNGGAIAGVTAESQDGDDVFGRHRTLSDDLLINKYNEPPFGTLHIDLIGTDVVVSFLQ